MITFYYGVMSSGKSLQLMKTRYNYISSNKNVLTLIPNYNEECKTISSRAMKEVVEVDLVLDDKKSMEEQLSGLKDLKKVDAIFIDEVQFLNIGQVRELRNIAKKYELEIYCYGLLTTTDNDMFPSSKELLLLAHKAKQLHSLCQVCGNEYASHHIKHDGKQHDKDSYESVCYECWLEHQK